MALAEIAAESLALPRPSICAGYLAQVEALLERHGVRVPERVSVRHWNTAVSFASTGRALALVPASFVNGATSVAVIPIAEPDAELVTWLLHSEETVPGGFARARGRRLDRRRRRWSSTWPFRA